MRGERDDAVRTYFWFAGITQHGLRVDNGKAENAEQCQRAEKLERHHVSWLKADRDEWLDCGRGLLRMIC